MLDCARNGPKNENPTFELIDCVKDKPEVHGKFKRALTTLREVSDTFRMNIENFDDDAIALVKDICEQWGHNWIKDFPNINLTPKAHDMIWVLPEILKRRRTFHMFYKMEERGESIHAELNRIERKIWCIRNQEKRLWKFIQLYELKNQLDISIIVPKKRSCG